MSMRRRVVIVLSSLALLGGLGLGAAVSASALTSSFGPGGVVVITPDPADTLPPELPDACPENDCVMVNE